MERLGVYSDFHKNIESSAAFLRNTKENTVLVNSIMHEKEAGGEEKNFQEYLKNAYGMQLQDLAWGRVIQKGQMTEPDKVQGVKQDDKNEVHMGGDVLLCAFAEVPTAVELFQKVRNMDWRNVEERTFAAGGKIFDFTV